MQIDKKIHFPNNAIFDNWGSKSEFQIFQQKRLFYNVFEIAGAKNKTVCKQS